MSETDRVPMIVIRPELPPVPDVARLHVLGRDTHDVPVPMARMLENVLDWEHLPWVHPQSFVASELLGSGPGWYRARFGNAARGGVNDVRVVLTDTADAFSRWFIYLERGPREGHLVHTTATTTAPGHIHTDVTFYAPDAPANDAVRRAMFSMFKRQYDALYVQDIDMMSERQRALDALAARDSSLPADGVLGPLDAVLARAPFEVRIAGRRFWVRARAGAPELVGADCPHALGPLPAPRGDEALVCPWHGYRFDPATHRSCDGRGLRLAAPPPVVVEAGVVRVALEA